MKKILSIIFTFTALFLIVSNGSNIYAQPEPTATPTTSPGAGVGVGTTPAPIEGKWVKDQEVTFVGKTATRANDFLEWTLKNYNWINISETNPTNPLQKFWFSITVIVYSVLGLFVLGAAFVMIITRGQNLTIVKFIPRFMMVVLLIFFSFAIVRFLYQTVDVVQGFFLRVPDLTNPTVNRLIEPKDLLFIAFDYKSFTGFRQLGIEFDESAFISLLLVKLTAITYYVMTGLLLIRKIIMWFFIIVSPIFPLLLFFRPVRNTAKIWVGEFFRWLLYAPLFALFLHGLVVMWRDRIPLNFDFLSAGRIPGTDYVYPTAINILIGGPGQQIGINNSVNLRDTFALYVVALLMLWVVILLPFLLLQIFLDYLNNVSITENPVYKKITTQNIPWLNRSLGGPSPTPPGQPPTMPGSMGLAKSLPFFNKKSMQIPTSRSESVLRSEQLSNTSTVRETKDVMRLANLSVPKMRDIARYETSMISNNTTVKQEVSRFTDTLEKISKPTIVGMSADRDRYTTIKEKLVTQQQKGDSLAGSILNATKVSSSHQAINASTQLTQVLRQLANPTTIISHSDKEKILHIKDALEKEKEKGSQLATSVLETSEKITSQTVTETEKQSVIEKLKELLVSEKKKGNEIATEILPQTETTAAGVTLPTVNKVQQVSIEEYEEVKKLWVENYQNMDAPKSADGVSADKHTWISNDIEKITETINLLSSPEQSNVDKGMEMVANILPFLLVGGFSKNEVVAYLKAKMEAGKSVIADIDKKREDEDTMVEASSRSEAAKNDMVMHQEIVPEEERSLESENEPKKEV